MPSTPAYDKAFADVIAKMIHLHQEGELHAVVIKFIAEDGEQQTCCGGCRGCLEMLNDESLEDIERDAAMPTPEVLPN